MNWARVYKKTDPEELAELIDYTNLMIQKRDNRKMNIAVYCGANAGNNPHFKENATELGHILAQNNHTLVYGGGFVGLMGAVSDAVMEDGGKIIGVITRFLVEWETARKDVKDMTVTETLSERKAKMIELADAFVALPGGSGTLDEIAEVISLCKLNQHPGPCVLLNIDGFYEPLRAMFESMIACDFLTREELSHVHFLSDASEITAVLQQYEERGLKH